MMEDMLQNYSVINNLFCCGQALQMIMLTIHLLCEQSAVCMLNAYNLIIMHIDNLSIIYTHILYVCRVYSFIFNALLFVWEWIEWKARAATVMLIIDVERIEVLVSYSIEASFCGMTLDED